MDRNKYIDLVERRRVYRDNVGALDFLIRLGEKRNYLATPEEVYADNVSRSAKYNKLKQLNKGIGKNPRANEFAYLLDYAGLLRNVQMTQTYVGLIRFLIPKFRELDVRRQNELLKHVRASYIVTGDESIFELLASVDADLIGKISLPKAVVDSLSHEFQGKVRVGTTIHDSVFTYQDSAFKIDKMLEGDATEMLQEQKYGLSMNRAVIAKDSAMYNQVLNSMFAGFGLCPVQGIDLSSDNFLATIEVQDAPVADDVGLVSIIMSCYESEGTVAYALESLLSQTYRNIEVLVCDDGSQDQSLETIRTIAARDARVKVFRSKKNQGTYNIRNALLDEAKGEFITFQDADDWSHPQRLEHQVKYLIEENVPICSSRWVRVDPKGQVIFFVDGRALRFCVVSTMVRRSVFSVVPRFRSSLVAADTEFHETCISLYGESNVRVLEKPLILGLWGDGSLTKKEGLQAESNGRVALRRRNYSDIAARQRVLGSDIVADRDVEEVLKQNGIYREYSGVVRVGVTE